MRFMWFNLRPWPYLPDASRLYGGEHNFYSALSSASLQNRT
jgi:hypothetical protein